MTETIISQFIAAGIGTIAFSVLFFVPRKYYLICGIIGGTGWLICCLCNQYLCLSIEASTFWAAAFVVICSRIGAFAKKCPVTLFLISGIFPLVPGTGIYQTIYHMIMGETDLSSLYARQTIGIAVAIVLGIIFVFEIPQKFLQKKKPEN